MPSFTNDQVHMPAGYEPSLAVVYAAWAGLIVLMYALTHLWLRWRARTAPPPAPAPAGAAS
jgi:hypothetical protein